MAKEGKEKAPILLKILVAYKIFLGILMIVLAVIVGLIGGLLGVLGDLGAILGIVAFAGAIVIALIGLAEIGLALGLLHLKKWAWWANIILNSIYIILELRSLTLSLAYLIGILINVGVVIYLFRIRTEFGVKENVL